MEVSQLPLFKELNPYAGDIDRDNRWIKLAKLVPWGQIERLYLGYFDARKHEKVKGSRLIMGLFLGQMIMRLSDVQIVEYFHENPYFQYFCGYNQFVVKRKKTIIDPSLLSKRRRRLGRAFIARFESIIIDSFSKQGLIKGKKLILDATVFSATISYPNDVKLLNIAREYCCQTILKLKRVIDPNKKIRTYRKTAKKVAMRFQKTKKKTGVMIRRTRKQMLQFLRRNLQQCHVLLAQYDQAIAHGKGYKNSVMTSIKKHIKTAGSIYEQQYEMARKRGRRVANRIVSFKQPHVRPIIRGKERNRVEFGAKAHVAIVDGYAMLDDCESNAYHEGNRLPDSLKKHVQRFHCQPDVILADQLYATRANRALLKELAIDQSFRTLGRPSSEIKKERKKRRLKLKAYHGERNAIEGLFGALKSHYNLDKIRWRVPHGDAMQIRMGLIASNLNRALAYS